MIESRQMPSHWKGSRGTKVIGTVSWKEVDEGWVRYDQIPGSTHLLSPLARYIIDLIEASPQALTLNAIAEQVLITDPEADSADYLVEVESTLRILCEAQLIEPCQLDRQ